MSPAQIAAAIVVSLTAGMTKAEIIAAAAKRAIESYKAKQGGSKP